MRAAPERCIVCGDRPVPVVRRGALVVVRSPGCGLEWRDPFPDAEELGDLYATGYFERWGVDGSDALERVRAMKRGTYRALFDEIRRHRAAGPLLDVGCAMGFLLDVAQEQGFDAYGLEVNAEAVEFARRRFGERVQQGAFDADVFPDLCFGVITLVDVFEHVADPARLLAGVSARLAPGGILAAVLPNAASWVRRMLRSRWPHYAPEHLYHWSPASLRRFLRDRGWDPRTLRTGFRKTFTASYLTAYAACVGSWLPPGLRLLGKRSFRLPTGEMLLIAVPLPPLPPEVCESQGEAAPESGSRA